MMKAKGDNSSAYTAKVWLKRHHLNLFFVLSEEISDLGLLEGIYLDLIHKRDGARS